MGWDEWAQHRIGEVSHAYVHQNNQELLSYVDKDYGVAFELPLIYIEKALHLQSSQAVYQMRHLVTHLFFLLACLCFYLLLYALYKSQKLALLGYFLLVSNPLLYAHSFFNSKDIPLLSMFVICMYLLSFIQDRIKMKHVLALAAGTAILINLRIVGLFFFGLVGLTFLIQFLKKKEERKKLALLFATYTLSTIVILIAIWPLLWTNPWGNFLAVFENMTKFRWEGEMLFLGKKILSTATPWYYIPVWIIITSSIIFSVLWLASIGSIIASSRTFIARILERKYFITLYSFVIITISFASIFILKPVLYDSWRQFFFLYPFLILGIIYLLSGELFGKKMKIALTLSAVYIILFQLVNIATLFPYSHVYFNEIVHKAEKNEVRQQFEMDYWGTAYTEALHKITAADKRAKIKIGVANVVGEHSIRMLSEEDQKRIEYTDLGDCDYFITCYRYHPEDYPDLENNTFYEIKRLNSSICTIFKFNE